MASGVKNFNFPPNLDISPSIPEHITTHSPSHLPDKGAFGSAAQREAIERYGIAGRVWEAAYLLSLYISPPPNWAFDPPFVRQTVTQRQLTFVELGSGSGMVSSSIADILNPVKDVLIVTDLPEVCPLLETNMKTKHKKPLVSSRNVPDYAVFVRPLAWGDDEHAMHVVSEFLCDPDRGVARPLTHIICSDLVYFPELLAPLLRTLLRLTSLTFAPHVSPTINLDVTVVISYKVRSLPKETPFWAAFGLWFIFEPVLVKDGTIEGDWQRFSLPSDDVTFIFTAHRRLESLTWKVPTDNQDLLSGVGAWGNNSKKGDDTFETLLFMNLEEYPEL